MDEIPADFAFKTTVTLHSLEDGMLAVESNIKIGIAILAVSLGRIKREGLYLSVAPSFKHYCHLERTNLTYPKAIHLAAVGEKYWEFQKEIRSNDIKLSQVMSKMRLLDRRIVDGDPLWWDRFKNLSVRELKAFLERRKLDINVYSATEKPATVTVNRSSLYIGNMKVRGINLNEVQEKTIQGKRAVIVWVDDDNEARRIRRMVGNQS